MSTAQPAPYRLPVGGRIDRGTLLRATVDGAEFTGHPGDTLASALLAAGRIEVAPSPYRRRPRGIMTAGVDEPNALVTIAGAAEAIRPATVVELFDGLSAATRSGRGRLDPQPDDARYDKVFTHVEVLVVGAGPAGLAATLAASAGGARVLLVDDQPEPGGRLLSAGAGHDDAAPGWVRGTLEALAERPEVRILARATAFGHYDGNYLLVAQRRTEHLGAGAPHQVSRQRLWHVRARHVVLATGAQERPMVFADNDRPGIMLASAVRTYLHRYAVAAGRRAVIATTDDSAYRTAVDLAAAGVEVAAVLDSRTEPPAAPADRARAAGIEVRAATVPCGTASSAAGRITAVDLAPTPATGTALRPRASTGRIECDLLAVCGGWDPAGHLVGQSRGTLRWAPAQAAFIPDRLAPAQHVAGAARGHARTADCIADGHTAGVEAAVATGYPGPGGGPGYPGPAGGTTGPAISRPAPTPPRPVWLVPGPDGDPGSWRDHFVDPHRDATVADIWRAVGAGLHSPEHVKRYTTIGTGWDQGRASGVPAAGVLATALGLASPAELGVTTSRAPSVPVSFALLAGRDRGPLHDPVRRSPMHDWHVRAGARFEDVGQWRRPRYYPRPGEDMAAAVLRECRAARTGVAVLDASTLGMIDVIGADAGEFLNRLYINAFAKLPVGSIRYGVLCTADGMVFDDGVVMRPGPHHFCVTTTTGNAAAVLDWFEEWSQTEWPRLEVRATSATEQWATVAVVGPAARRVLARIAPGLDVSAVGFGFMTLRETTLDGGVPARIARVSFSGELAYEVNVAAWSGLAVWELILAAGADLDITPYGTETMHVLRAEKGFPIIGQDTDGTVTPVDLGLAALVSTRKDFVGRRSLSRPDAVRADRRQLVALLPTDPAALLPEGAQLVADGVPITPERGPVPMIGHVTSSYRSATLGRTFALALVRGGRGRLGQRVHAPLCDPPITAIIADPVLYDPKGTRRDG